MLTQINSIKGLGVFENYNASPPALLFRRYNVIYGENGAGKTTLSRLLASLDTGYHPDYPFLEYNLGCELGALTNKVPYGRKVRVFNSDYVEANIGRFDDPLRHILILGEENKALAEELNADILLLADRNRRLETIDNLISRAEAAKGRLFSQIASTIGEATVGSSLRSYRKPDAEAAFARMTGATELTEAQLSTNRTTLRQELMPEIQMIRILHSPRDLSSVIAGAVSNCRELTLKSAQASVIERLAQNPEISKWVESGLHLHKLGQSRCEFCDKPLSSDRIETLAKHFSDEDQRLKDEIETSILQIDETVSMLNTLSLPDQLAFYSELRGDYESAQNELRLSVVELLERLKQVRDELVKKLTLRTTSYETSVYCDAIAVIESAEAVNAIIGTHNQKSLRFNEEKDFARVAIEHHYLHSVKLQVEEFTARIEELRNEAILLKDGGESLADKRSLEQLAASIAEKRAKVSNAHAGGANLTALLRQFLGRTDLRFESTDEGYRVLRRGKAAKRLSEGEKTAIAFLYFLVQLQDQDFDLAEGIVAIDDPISSLDASAIYQAFAFLKNGVKDAKQLFLFTHNFEFLRLIINWLRTGARSHSSFAMVVCEENAGGRAAKLAPLDNLLVEHATEYHFLFKVLYTFRSDGTIGSCYHIPNVARKVLESFLEFYVPSNKSMYQKLGDVDFEESKKTAIYKFTNDLSHPTGKTFDPALVAETQKNVLHLLEMIRQVAPSHYDGLVALCGP